MNFGNNLSMKKVMLNKNCCGIYYTRKQVLKFERRKESLSDEDILNLFMGFIRLIKKSTEIEVEERYLLEITKLKNIIKKYEKGEK